MRGFPALLLLLFAGSAAASQDARSDRVRTGLVAPDRASREEAAALAREWARTDPAGVEAVFPDLDLRGRAELLRALAGAGTAHAAQVALKYAGDPEEALFRAIIAGLSHGGGAAILAEVPEGVKLSDARRAALEELRLRWRVEERFARLKSRSGRTGHYDGQYADLRPLLPGALEVLWAMARDRRVPLPGDATSESYVPLHPGMLDFERDEMRTLAAYAFGELLDPKDAAWKQRLLMLWYDYWNRNAELEPVEHDEIAPALAFSLHDLGVKFPAQQYIDHLHTLIRNSRRSFVGLAALWDLGYAYMRVGDPEQGERYYQQVIMMTEDYGQGVACYNLACHFAVRAAREPKRERYYRAQALHWLKQAIEEYNFIDWVWMQEDGDLNTIRDEPEYQRLLKGLQRRYPGRKRHQIEKSREKFLKPKDEAK